MSVHSGRMGREDAHWLRVVALEFCAARAPAPDSFEKVVIRIALHDEWAVCCPLSSIVTGRPRPPPNTNPISFVIDE